MAKHLKILIDIMLVFLFIQNSQVNGVPVSTAKLVIVYLLIRTDWSSYLNFILSNKVFKYILLILLSVSLYYIGLCVVKGLPYTTLLYSFGLFFFEFTIGATLLAHYLVNRYSYDQLIFVVLTSFVIQSLLLIAGFVFEPLRTLNSAIFTGDSNISFDSALRVRGLGSNAGATLSYIQSFGGFWAMLYLLQPKASGRQKAYAILSAIIVFISLIFVGRTGMVFVLIYIVAGISQLSFNNKSIKPAFKILIPIVLITITLMNTYQFILPYSVAQNFDETSGRAFEVIDNYQETGSVSTKSSDHIMRDMIFFPKSQQDFIFGKGLWKDRVRVNSDLGVVQLMFAGGLILITLFYSIFLMIPIGLFKSSLFKQFSLGVLLLFPIFFLSEWKEPFSLKGMVVCNFMLIYFIHKIIDDKKKNVISE